MATTAVRNARFDAILDADRLVKTLHTLAVYGADYATRLRNENAIPAAKEKFFALLDGLTAEELPVFMAYRRETLAAE